MAQPDILNPFSQIAIPLLVGFLLDTLLGDPIGWPHPIIWFGNAIAALEKRFNHGEHQKRNGAFGAILLIVFVYGILSLLSYLLSFSVYVYYPVASILVFYGLANRCLIDEGLKVEHQLSSHGLDAGRKQLSYIVGRETAQLSENKIRASVLETLAENLSDGIIAPLFYYALGGFPLMFAYKMINTLDSMVGYKNERYKNFGYFSAKIDDLANLIPARITALLMVLLSFSARSFSFIFRYGHKHASPNSGYPESALAGILNCRFGGPNVYHGILVEKPYIGNNEREFIKQDIFAACLLNYAVSVSAVILVIALWWLV